MLVFGLFRQMFVDVIEWPHADNETLAWRFPVAGNEIKDGAQLTVREGQKAVFLNEGQFADVLGPGLHTLSTQNLPLLTSLGAWRHGFTSPFKADVVFVSTREFRNLKWGTHQPILLRDPEFGLVRVRAFGGFGLRVVDPKEFIRECAGVRDLFGIADLEESMRKHVVSRFSDALSSLGIPVIDLSTRTEDVAYVVGGRIAKSFDALGVELTHFTLESVSVPEDLLAAIDDHAKMNLAMSQSQKFATWQTLGALKERGPAANLAADVAAGSVLGKMMGEALGAVHPGAASGSKFCTECGAENTLSAKFCQDCGQRTDV